jgi:Ni2+-binding GTPase involved in maturation of urease and hydrogenase
MKPQGGSLFALVGGFLGAGKTTAIGQLVARLKGRGLRCGIITNDQGHGLVDTVLAQERTGAVAEITGGCFCCRLDELVSAVSALSAEERPDVFLAEPVGSCTDLMATVLLPLGRVYDLPLRLAPLSVVLDGRRAYATLVSRGRSRDFSKDVGYIYRKQIEEAEILVINKMDLLPAAQLAKLNARLAMDYPGREIFAVSARTGDGIGEWLEAIEGRGCEPAEIMDVDYQRYGEGEALLGWLNATVKIGTARKGADGAGVLHGLVHAITDELERTAVNIAHFKMTLQDGHGNTMRAQVTRNGEKPILGGAFDGPVRGGTLLINLRAEAEPEALAAAVETGLAATLAAVAHKVTEMKYFKPGQPKPTHRIAAVV